MHFIYSVKGVYPPSAELTRCVRCDFSSWKGMGVHTPHSWFQSGGQLCAIPAPWLWHSGARTGGTSQTERRSEGKAGSRCGLCTGASQVPPSVFHSAEAVAHGNGAGPALLPYAADAGSGVLRRFAGVSRSPPAVCCSLVLTQRGLIPLCPLHGPQHPGCATSRARQGRVRASVVIPGLFDHLFLRSNPQALPGTKKPTVVCCPQLEAYHCTSGTAVNFRNVTLNIFIFFFLQSNSNRYVLSNRALRCKMYIVSDSAGTNISKTII